MNSRVSLNRSSRRSSLVLTAIHYCGGLVAAELNVVVDPLRSFGQPIDAASSVPTAVLATVGIQEGISGCGVSL